MNPQSHRTAWRAMLACCLLAGIFFRFYNVEKKLFWYDETVTAQLTGGHTMDEMEREYAGHLARAGDLWKFQRVASPNGVSATVRAVAEDDPQHAPLYYVALRLWAAVWGDSVFSLRMLSVLAGLCSLPALWWLSRELFHEHPHRDRIAAVAVGLLALSPVFVLYSQEARPYAMLAAIMMAASALLLRALRLGGWPAWTVYALIVTLGLYTHTLFILAWLGHGLYLFAYFLLSSEKSSRSERHRLGGFALATVAALLLFSPWLTNLSKGRDTASKHVSWVAEKPRGLKQVVAPSLTAAALYFDPYIKEGRRENSGVATAIFLRLISLMLFALIVCGLVAALQDVPRRISLFILMSATAPWLMLFIVDVASGGSRSAVARFHFDGFIGMHLAVAFLLASKLASPVSRRAWIPVVAAIVFAGFYSCLLSSQAVVWSNKNYSKSLLDMAKVVNAAPHSLIVSKPQNHVLTFIRLIHPDVRFLFLAEDGIQSSELEKIRHAAAKGQVFFFFPKKQAMDDLASQRIFPRKVDGNEFYRFPINTAQKKRVFPLVAGESD